MASGVFKFETLIQLWNEKVKSSLYNFICHSISKSANEVL